MTRSILAALGALAALPALAQQQQAPEEKMIRVEITGSSIKRLVSETSQPLSVFKAEEFAKQGLRVNCVCPAGVATPLLGAFKFPEDADPELLARLTLVQRLATPAQVAAVHAHAGQVSDSAQVELDAPAVVQPFRRNFHLARVLRSSRVVANAGVGMPGPRACQPDGWGRATAAASSR